MNCIEIKNLKKIFGDFIAVNSISFSVKEGEIFGLLGPNGAGKTTTIRMLCGILKPTSGEGYIAGFNIFKESEKIKRRIGYMSQRFSLYDELTVIETIDFYAGIYGVKKEILKERKRWSIELADLKDKKDELVKNLPTGFKQRLALVCAIIHNPPIVFLDEPTSGVDPLSRRKIWELIYYMRNNYKTTFLVTTHYMEEAEYCEKIAFIQNGTIIQMGTPAEIKNKFRNSMIVVKSEYLEKTKGILKGNENVIDIIQYSNYIHIFLKEEYLEKILELLKKENVKFEEPGVLEPTLQDAFLVSMKK